MFIPVGKPESKGLSAVLGIAAVADDRMAVQVEVLQIVSLQSLLTREHIILEIEVTVKVVNGGKESPVRAL